MRDLLKRGGKHYKQGAATQPIELIMSQGLDFAEGNIVKYVCRHRRKGGVEDIKKLIHYAEFLLEEYNRELGQALTEIGEAEYAPDYFEYMNNKVPEGKEGHEST